MQNAFSLFANLPLLSILIWSSIAGGLLLLMLGESKPCRSRWLALIFSVLIFALCIPLLALYDSSTWHMQFVERTRWIPLFNIDYALGVDGFAILLIALTCFMTILVAMASWQSVKDRVGQYLGAFLIMQGFMVGMFAALDAILFYVFFEAMLIPMFIIIGIWGGDNRVYATIKFFLYTFLGSVFFLIALLYLNYVARKLGVMELDVFQISVFQKLPLSLVEQQWLFLAFLVAFAVKVPMWPVHTWLPDAHTEAPTGGSVILAAITLKIGGYGMIRFLLPIVPDACQLLSEVVIFLSLIAIVYIGFVAVVQQDMKKLIAYSSISHMGFVTLGLFVVYGALANTNSLERATMGIEGAMAQMISHGFISAALFLCVGVLYDRMHSRQIKDYGGVVNTMPVFASFFMLFAMANAGLPGTSGFVGEFLVILSAFKAKILYAFLAALTLILGAAYTLWMFKRVVFGAVQNKQVEALTDITWREKGMFTILAIAVLAMGIAPAPVFNVMHSSVDQLVVQMTTSKL